MNLPNKLTVARIAMSIIIIILLLFPFYQIGFEFPKYLVSGINRDTTNNKLYLCVYTEAGEYFEDDLIAKSKEMDFSTKFKIDFYNKYNKDNI